jgi:hypothetical protein
MAEAPQRPPDPVTAFPQPADVVQPTPPLSRLPRVGVVLAAGRSQRLESVTGGGPRGLRTAEPPLLSHIALGVGSGRVRLNSHARSSTAGPSIDSGSMTGGDE